MNTLPANTIEQMREVYERISKLNPDSQVSLTMRKSYGGPEQETFFYVSIGGLTATGNVAGIDEDLAKAESDAISKYGTPESRRANDMESLRKQAQALGVTINEGKGIES